MILVYLILILMAGGIIAWLTGRKNPVVSRYVSLLSVCIDLLLVLSVYFRGDDPQRTWLAEYWRSWIPHFGIQLHLALDGLSLLLLILTYFIGILAVLISWKEISYKTGFFHFNIPVDPGRNYRCISFNGPVFVLFFLGSDADPHVFSDWHLGT